ncbi:MAG: hypothetical protein H0V79_03825 [Actinobacteria bacterium]|nr:hypothetical protein [Actinomycetota bacterium]
MLAVPFLTDLDSRAAVKGSRDPLGIQPIWTRFGRHVVGNLTTVSTSVRDFTTLLLGYHFAQQVAEDLGPGSELEAFLKWEQLAAYARAIGNGDRTFRGTERVQRSLSEGSRITLSASREHQILGNQKIYGLWGLYTVPARSSGLLEGNPPRLTPVALDVIERDHLAILRDDARQIVSLLSQPKTQLDKRAAIIETVARVLRRQLRARERELYRSHLLDGGPQDSTDGRQRQLAMLLDGPDLMPWSPARVAALAKEARGRGAAWHALAHRLDRIGICETVLAPIAALFTYLLGQDGRRMDDVVDRLRRAWGDGLRTIAVDEVRSLRAELGDADPRIGDRWVSIAETAGSGSYGELLELLFEQNSSVLAARGGAPWVESRAGRLHVRFRDEQGSLPAKAGLATLWRFPYFLDSLHAVAIAVRKD